MGVTHSSQVRGRKRSELVVGERLDDAAAVVAGERDEQLVVVLQRQVPRGAHQRSLPGYPGEPWKQSGCFEELSGVADGAADGEAGGVEGAELRGGRREMSNKTSGDS